MPSSSSSAPAGARPRRVYPALTRPVLVAGMEQRVVIPLALLAFYFLPPLVWQWNVVTPAISLAIVFGLFPRLRRLAQRDPQFFAALPRHVRLAQHYPARAHHAAARRRSVPTL